MKLRKSSINLLKKLPPLFLLLAIFSINVVSPIYAIAESLTTTDTLTLESPIGGKAINDNTPLMQWSDVTFTDGRTVKGYNYEIYYNCSNELEIPKSCTGKFTKNNLPSSQYQAGTTHNNKFFWRVQAIDNNDGKGDWSKFGIFTIDTISPSQPRFTAPENGLMTNINSITLKWDSTDSLSGIKGYFFRYVFTSENGKVTNWNTGLTTPILSTTNSRTGTYGHGNGQYVMYVKTVDNAGNVSTESEPLTVSYDGSAPITPTGLYFMNYDNNIKVECGGFSNTHHVTEHWDSIAGDNSFKHYEYSSFNAPSGSSGLIQNVFTTNYFNSSWWNIPIEGTYGFQVRAVDKFGNKSPWALGNTVGIQDACRITIDWTAPVVEITGIRYEKSDKIEFITNDKSPLLYGSATDNYEIDSIKVKTGDKEADVKIDGTKWTAQFPDLVDGNHTVTLEITDKAGNIFKTTKEITVDSIAPTAIYTHYIDGEVFEGEIATVKYLSQLSFTSIYKDETPSSGLLYDSFSIFQAQDDGSFRFMQNGKKSYCGWRADPNRVILSGTEYTLTEQIAFIKCINNLPDGEYYMAHQVYDRSVRRDIPSIYQFRDVLGLHFIIKNTPEVSIISPYTSVIQNSSSFDITANIADGNGNIEYLWSGSDGSSGTNSSFNFNPTTAGTFTYTLKVTDEDGDSAQDSIQIIVTKPIETQEKTDVLGATTKTKPTLNRAKNRLATTMAEEEEEVEEQEKAIEEQFVTSSVLGEETDTCDVKRKLIGNVYEENKSKNFEDIKIILYILENGKKDIIAQLTTDSKGSFETEVCPGSYYFEVDDNTLPSGYKVLGGSVQDLKVNEIDSTISIRLVKNKSFIQKYWYWILAVMAVTIVLIVSVRRERSKN